MIKTLLLDTFLLMGIIWMLISIVYFCIRLDRLLSSMEKPVVETREETAEVVLSEEDTSSPSVHSDFNSFEDYQKKLAFLYIDGGKFEESISCLKKIVEMEPDRFYNWYAYSEVLMLIGEYEEAVSLLEKALKQHHRAELFYQMSNCYFHLKEEQKAKDFLEIALDLDPSLSEDMQQKYPYIREEVKNKIKNKRQ